MGPDIADAAHEVTTLRRLYRPNEEVKQHESLYRTRTIPI